MPEDRLLQGQSPSVNLLPNIGRQLSVAARHLKCILERDVEQAVATRGAALSALHVRGVLFSNRFEPIVDIDVTHTQKM